MEPVHIVTGTAVPLDRSDVDTDQIIPSDWLKQVERTGFVTGLFSEWREDRVFVLYQEQYAGATIFDLVLPKVAAGVPVTRRDMVALGEGGLCLGCDVCHWPVCPFGK